MSSCKLNNNRAESFQLAAQVVLTVRDPETWHRSVHNVIIKLYKRVLRPFFWTTELGRQYTTIIGWSLRCMFNGDLSKANCINAFQAHTDAIKARVPQNQLLIWRPQDGWAPLAE
jgi:hypothetical protein